MTMLVAGRAASVAALLASLMSVACATTTTVSGDSSPTASDEKRVDALPLEYRETVRERLAAVDRAWQSPEFWEVVRGRHFLNAATGKIVEGEEVSKRLKPLNPRGAPVLDGGAFWSFRKTWVLGMRANAETWACGPMRLNRSWIRPDHAFANTLAHELTHLVGNGNGTHGCNEPNSSLYQDDGHGEHTTPWLVSYAIGDLVECWLRWEGDVHQFRACSSTKRSSPCGSCPLWKRCCAGDAPELVVEARKTDASCSALRCESVDAICALP